MSKISKEEFEELLNSDNLKNDTKYGTRFRKEKKWEFNVAYEEFISSQKD